MKSINWSEIDPKYKWAATDADGGVYAYSVEPQVKERLSIWGIGGFNESLFLRKGRSNKNWQQSLQKRPGELK